MSRLLIGFSGIAFMVCVVIQAMEWAGQLGERAIEVVWFWVFAVLAIPFVMLLAGIILILAGALLISPFVGLNYLDESFDYEEEE